jgi:hypothetical protein
MNTASSAAVSHITQHHDPSMSVRSDEVGSLTQALDTFKPNETKTSKGGQVVHQHGLISPEPTPDVEGARLQEDERRRQRERGTSSVPDKSSNFAVTRSPDPSDTEDEDSGDAIVDSGRNAQPKGPEKRKKDASKDKQKGKSTAESSGSVPATKPPPPSVSDAEDSDEVAEDMNRGAATKRTERKKEKIAKGKNKEVTKKKSNWRRPGAIETGREENESGNSWTAAQEAVVDQVMNGRFNYQVLGIAPGPQDEATVRKTWKELAVILDPDKNKHPQAREAFKSE